MDTQKQKEHEEMAELMYYFMLICFVLACVWAVVEVFKAL